MSNSFFKIFIKYILIVFIISISNYCFGQPSFKEEIDKIYNFYPHKISKIEQEEKTPKLNAFFNKIKSDTTKYLPLLRSELLSNNHLPYFYYDCSHLLLILSKSNSDKEICAKSFEKCDINDLDPKIYFSLISYLSKNNINTTNASIKILEDSTFHFFVPEHALDFTQGYCLTYLLLPLDSNFYTDTLIKIFNHTKYISTQKSIITALWFSYSCKGDEFLLKINEGNALNKDISDYAYKLLKDKKLEREYRKQLNKINQNKLVEIQKSALNRLSDEAILDLDFATKARRIKYSCQ